MPGNVVTSFAAPHIVTEKTLLRADTSGNCLLFEFIVMISSKVIFIRTQYLVLFPRKKFHRYLIKSR